ncbi:hypothetical protein FOA52_005518 [Chlamydomonas sp. UWO 241]|nr:hypothetical protein FOA52_005518 [Chlamydomonas sp. UWO 241]
MLRGQMAECSKAAGTAEEKQQLLLQAGMWGLMPPDQLLQLRATQQVDPELSVVDQLSPAACAFLASAGKMLGKNMSGLSSTTPFQLPGTSLWVVHSSGSLNQRGRRGLNGITQTRSFKQWYLAVRNPDHPPATAKSEVGMGATPLAMAAAAAEAAAAATAAAKAAKAVKAFAELPPSFKALLTADAVVEVKGRTQGWRYYAFERFVYMQVAVAPLAELSPAPPLQGQEQEQQQQQQQQQQESAQEEEERQRAKRPRSDSGEGGAAAAAAAAALALPVPAVPGPGEAPAVPPPEGADLDQIAHELLGCIFDLRVADSLARFKQLLLSLRGTAGDFQPLKQLRLPPPPPLPAPQPAEPFAPPFIQWPLFSYKDRLWDLDAVVLGEPEVDPEWQLSLLNCVGSAVGADTSEELLLMCDHYGATWLHRAAECANIRLVRWGCGEAVPRQPSPLNDTTVRRLLIARTRHGWLLYHESARSVRCGRIEITAVVLRAMTRQFRPEVVQGLVFRLHNKHFVNNGGNDTLQAACVLAFCPGFVLSEPPTHGENGVEELLSRLRVQ